MAKRPATKRRRMRVKWIRYPYKLNADLYVGSEYAATADQLSDESDTAFRRRARALRDVLQADLDACDAAGIPVVWVGDKPKGKKGKR